MQCVGHRAVDSPYMYLFLVVSPQDFFEVFGASFRRNAKWSERLPVPQLGDASTPYEKVTRVHHAATQDYRSSDTVAALGHRETT